MTELADLAEAVRDFFTRSHRALDRRMRAQGASFARAKLLMFVAGNDGVRSTDLAEAFGHAPRTVTEAVDGLERDGLVQRSPDPDDRRVKRIAITEAGRAAVASSEPCRQAFLEEVFGAIDTAEQVQLAALLGKLNERLQRIADADEAPAG